MQASEQQVKPRLAGNTNAGKPRQRILSFLSSGLDHRFHFRKMILSLAVRSPTLPFQFLIQASNDSEVSTSAMKGEETFLKHHFTRFSWCSKHL